jgi:hypothetical protein
MKKIIYLLFLIFFYHNLFAPYPIINLKLIKDSMDGYNLFIELNNFTLAPEQVGKNNKSNTGHLHLYVNDIKIARVYSRWIHIPERYFNLKENLIRVTLNANMHGGFTIDGKLIEAILINTKD